MSREIVTPLLYVCPEEPDAYDGACYADGRTMENNVFVSIVDTEFAIGMTDGDHRHVMDDGSIVYPNLIEEEWDKMFIKER